MRELVGSDRAFNRQAMARELLDAETEAALARAWRDHGDEAALHRLVNAYSRLAIASARKAQRYQVPVEDLVQQANLGLMKAAEKFDPDRGVRFSTYAAWWIKASIQDYLMRNWSIVRMGATAAQKTLFFNLRRVRAGLETAAAARGEDLTSEALIDGISEELGVGRAQVEQMLGHMAGPDQSLNAPQSTEEGAREWVELLVDDGPEPAETVIGRQHDRKIRAHLKDAILALPERERRIVIERRLRDDPRTLTDLGAEMGVSKERIRQLEERALQRLREAMIPAAGESRAA
ncbi:RNA polymerase factor sigma-32 [Rhodovulum sp. YNF3179]|uniref:RNA polymerase factor sigma-32 n=1 Tax=Rhodovulum sp. YNF3179 TaxID=3425127 RepID=UPI003D334846